MSLPSLYIHITELLRIGGNWKHSACSTIENSNLESRYNSYLRYITYLALNKDGWMGGLVGWIDRREAGKQAGKEVGLL